MKKITIFLMAATMILGFAGISIAADLCAECVAPGTINRACPGEQGSCTSYPFDYEDLIGFGPFIDNDASKGLKYPNYCESVGKKHRRALFPACDCDNFQENDIVDIRMEILVNGVAGANGAYWAEDVDDDFDYDGAGIGLDTYASQTKACDEDDMLYYNGSFRGEFNYKYYDEDGDLQFGSPLSGYGAVCELYDDDRYEKYRVTVLEPDANATPFEHGFMITQSVDANDESIWAINIPLIRFDLETLGEGDVISVRVCLAKADSNGKVDLGGICGAACCCEITLGTLGCCVGNEDYKLIYPYATPMNDADWWYGFVITNLSGTDGEAEITVYEVDGDTATITVPVAANNMFVRTGMQLMDEFGGDIGDERAYFQVDTDFDASGFLFIGNDNISEAMGYLPVAK